MKVNILFSFVLIVSAIVLLYVGYFSWRRDKIYVSLALLPVSIYSFGYAFEILCTSIENVKFWIKVEYLGIAFLPVVWLLFALKFNGHKGKIKKNIVVLLFIIPFITLILNYTNDFHHLFYKELYMNNSGIFPITNIVRGPWYWVNIIYTYVIMVIGLIIFILAYFKAVSIIRKQILFLIIAWIIPWILDITYMLRVFHFQLDLCPLAFSVSGIISSYAIFKFKLLKITPIALEKVFSNMLDGVIILDSENNIVNFNNASKNIISELKYTEDGDKKIDEVLKEHKTLLKAINNKSYNGNLININDKGQSRYYKLNINNIYEASGESIGKILILNDVTEFELQREKLYNNLNFVETLMDAIPNPIYSKDEYGVYNHCNNAFTEYLGITKEDLIGNTAYAIFEEKLAEVYDKADMSLMREEGTQVYESKLMHKDGTEHDVIFSKSVVVNEQGNDKGVVGVILDITEQKKNRKKINKLSTLKEAMLDIGYSINEISDINDLLQLILDKVINCVDERNCGSILLLDENENLKIAVAKGYNSEEIKKFSIKLEDAWFKDGEIIDRTVIFNDIDKIEIASMLDTAEGIKIKSFISSPILIDGKCYGFLNIDSIFNNIFDEVDIELMEYMTNQTSIAITKHKLYEETIYLSRYDKLSNVYNRSYFEQLLHNNIYNDNTDKKEFFVAIFDLNGLKFVNDNYGHLAGDELIKTFAGGLSSLGGDSDIIGRFGGDEFVGVFFNVNSKSLINKFEELSEQFKNNPIIFGENKIICSYSYGVVNFPSDGVEFDQLIKIADKRMYEYKNKVKNKIHN
ncbi:histidine kinase N-terminal 7TM domain-containing diguanylate cyclase [Clostridium fungisolvens]|uniref:histidine kinase N-terminal 7TM domain-containing diguanylate cyclase n=1 Tax=Clostridium fungisolvens TaxID=1604897 RepID=UPI00160FCDCA|nr:histidine kinase N-terminal 7TM domain-containing protein [Clostridium fungisolvens]